MIQPQDDLVLVQVHTVRRNRGGVEFTGVIEGMGQKVTAFQTGDEVRGTADEVFADYVCVPSSSIRLANNS